MSLLQTTRSLNAYRHDFFCAPHYINESITTNKEFKHIQTRLFLGPHERQDYTYV